MDAPPQTRIGMPMDEFIRQYDSAPFELINGEKISINPAQKMVGIHISGMGFQLSEDDTLDGGDVLPDFSLPVRTLFA